MLLPDNDGRFGQYGGRFVSETLMPCLIELEQAWKDSMSDPVFLKSVATALQEYVGRPTPLTHAKRLSKHVGGAQLWLKREDLCHTGAHKINNCVGQGLLARRMGKQRIIAETGAGQHGVATATVAAWLSLDCDIFMGAEDMERQAPNVQRMRLLGANLVPVSSGSGTLKDAMNDALRDWVATVENTFYIIGSVCGPHPYPAMVRDFQRVIGVETRAQTLEQLGRLPDLLVACVGGGSNAMGLFHPFLEDDVAICGVEAAGDGIGPALDDVGMLRDERVGCDKDRVVDPADGAADIGVWRCSAAQRGWAHGTSGRHSIRLSPSAVSATAPSGEP